MLTDSQKDDVRRHCGFGVFGNNVSATPPSFGYRYYAQYLTLEYRLNNLSANQESLLTTNYIPNCNTLEAAIWTASENLDTDRAAVWYHNKNETSDRWKLYRLSANRLMDFLSVWGPAKLLSSNNCQVII